jgi:hypothetical protein
MQYKTVKKHRKKLSNPSAGVVRQIGLANGLVANKICAINEELAGLRFVVPLAARPTWPAT